MPGFRGATEIHYDADHARTRKAAFAALPEYSLCARCGKPMWKWTVEVQRNGRRVSALHWDHNGQRTGYLGFSHAHCNRDAGASEGGRRATKTYGHRRTRQTRTTHAGTAGPGW